MSGRVTTTPQYPEPAELVEEVMKRLPYVPLPKQALLIEALSRFVCRRGARDVFVLCGYAGTGKTSILGALLETMRSMKLPLSLLAPTGRAAKVASRMASVPASTLHKRLFRIDGRDPSGTTFIPARNKDQNMLFVADEASMITDGDGPGRSLLQYLIYHVYSGEGCGLILSGDLAQLPPIGQSDSPAMNVERLRSLGLRPVYFELDQPVRQRRESGILWNATLVRQRITKRLSGVPQLRSSGFDDVAAVSSSDLAELISDSWRDVGMEETLLITRSNHRANAYNSELRGRVMYADSPIERGERLVVAKNNYFWTRGDKNTPFLANGETIVVDWIGHTEKVYGRYFVDIEFHLPSSDTPVGAKLMLRSLVAEGASLAADEMNKFQTRVLAEQPGVLSEKIKALERDPWYNAIQAKYAYCVTCHKAQGGQWKHVYIDLTGISPESMDESFHRWLYTAITRATEKVFLVNPPFVVK